MKFFAVVLGLFTALLTVLSPAQEKKPDIQRRDDISTFLNEGWKITGDNHPRLVSGIWVSKKDPTKSLPSNPQQVRIRCTVIDLKCKETSVNLMVSTEEIKDEDWNITAWDSHKLIASHGDDAANPCQRHVLTMNFDSGAISASDIPTHRKGCEAFTDTESYDFVRVSSGVVQPIQKH